MASGGLGLFGPELRFQAVSHSLLAESCKAQGLPLRFGHAMFRTLDPAPKKKTQTLTKVPLIDAGMCSCKHETAKS